jgi:hypothetical protein
MNGRLVFLSFCLISSLPGCSHMRDISGIWQGRYGYGGEQADGGDIEFKVNLSQSGERIHGTLIEPSTSGGAVQGTVDGKVTPTGEIEFVKTFEGMPGPTPTVRYSGRINQNFRFIDGSWELQGSHGSFEMVRHETGPPPP